MEGGLFSLGDDLAASDKYYFSKRKFIIVLLYLYFSSHYT